MSSSLDAVIEKVCRRVAVPGSRAAVQFAVDIRNAAYVCGTDGPGVKLRWVTCDSVRFFFVLMIIL